MNEIAFPAGILQAPFFDLSADDAANYGAIGVVIGHEMGHGFDDQGSKFDAEGNLKNWWTPEDRKKFEARAACVIDQFNTHVVGEALRHNGRTRRRRGSRRSRRTPLSLQGLQAHARR